MRKKISVLITDLDNTLFDWVHVWYSSFNPMLEKISEISGIPHDQLISEIREVHQLRGTSEYAFLIEELPSLKLKHQDANLLALYKEAIDAFRAGRKEALKLYPSVIDTLKALRAKGVIIIGYTESMAFYTNYRIRHLGLDGALDYLYSPPDHEMPNNLTPEQIRLYPASNYTLNFTEHKHTPKGELKPNPDILKTIIKDVGADPSECLYVGDSLMKDIAMAQQANVMDAHALYGKAQDRNEYELLRAVTHWTPEQVQKEREILSAASVTPTHTLEASFSEILAKFDFQPSATPSKIDTTLPLLIDIWKKVVDVQQHFNDIEMRIRNVALTVLSALMGAAGYAQKEKISIELTFSVIPLSVFILAIALLILLAFWFMDRHWYHRLLYGAVKQGIAIENRIKTLIPEITLAEAIGKESRMEIAGLELRSTGKMNLFYGIIGGAIIVLMLILLLFGQPSVLTSDKPTLQGQQTMPAKMQAPQLPVRTPNINQAPVQNNSPPIE